ncbi:hypothetical protein C9I98_09145 [Photobacterium sanctipauli]|uniref:Uncharacterized protein n=1 Tax=Photobacterium sanctipauli TaxID=1342794 RepID=A0A2T3NVA3_9GAMM|nr:hypothetical protein [Photobacterium sanctipauli]PSW20210.1 hypothetical protein C9I98_09145 [Photobacterium sanctipauli]
MLFSYVIAGLSLSAMPIDSEACEGHEPISQTSVIALQDKCHRQYQQQYVDTDNEVSWQAQSESSDTSASFWDNWSGDLASPVMTTTASSSFYGLGVWMPEKYADDEILTVEDAKEWIKKHGLQMSFGVGGEDGNSPRVRFDYRWHDDGDLDDVFIQIDIPFQ